MGAAQGTAPGEAIGAFGLVKHLAPRKDLLILCGITLLAAIPRVVMLGQYPHGFQGDEASIAVEARRILSSGPIGLWTAFGYGYPTLPIYWTALVVAFLGDSIPALRFSTALLGIMTVSLLYCAGRALFGRTTATVAALAMSVSYWIFHYNRIIYHLNAAPLFGCLTLFLVGLAIQRQRLFLFGLAGIAMGLGFHTYAGYVSFYPVLAIGWLFMLYRLSWTDRLRQTLAFWIPALLVPLPIASQMFAMARGYSRITSVFSAPEYQAAIAEDGIVAVLAAKAVRAGSIYFTGRTLDFTDGLGELPLLDPPARLLLVLGLLVAFRRLLDWRYAIIVVAIGASTAGLALGITSFGENRRAIALAPLLFLAIGVGGECLIRGLRRISERIRPDYRRGAAYVTALAIGGYALFWNFDVYFRQLAPSKTHSAVFLHEWVHVAEYLSSQSGEPYVYFLSDQWSWDYESRLYLLPDRDGEDRSRNFGAFDLEIFNRQEDAVFILLDNYKDQLDTLQRLYPGGSPHAASETYQDGPETLFIGYRVQREGAANPLYERAAGGDPNESKNSNSRRRDPL